MNGQYVPQGSRLKHFEIYLRYHVFFRNQKTLSLIEKWSLSGHLSFVIKKKVLVIWLTIIINIIYNYSGVFDKPKIVNDK